MDSVAEIVCGRLRDEFPLLNPDVKIIQQELIQYIASYVNEDHPDPMVILDNFYQEKVKEFSLVNLIVTTCDKLSKLPDLANFVTPCDFIHQTIQNIETKYGIADMDNIISTAKTIIDAIHNHRAKK